MPEGFSVANGQLLRGDSVLLEGLANRFHYVTPVGGLLIISDGKLGLRVISTDGKVLIAKPLDGLEFSESPATISGDLAAVATADGRLHLISLGS